MLVFCSFIINQSLCSQKNSCDVLGYLSDPCSLFTVHEDGYQIWLHPVIPFDTTEPTLFFFTPNGEPSQGLDIQQHNLRLHNQKIVGHVTQVTSNNNTTIISTNEHHVIYRKDKKPIVHHAPKSTTSHVVLSTSIKTHEHDNSYFIENEITFIPSRQGNTILHSLVMHSIDNPNNKTRLFHELYDAPQHEHNQNAVVACHPCKREIAFKRLDNKLVILSSQNEDATIEDYDNYSIFKYLLVNTFKPEQQDTIDLIKYSPQGKFIVFLCPNLLVIYNKETGLCSYAQRTEQHYISMAFYGNTNILGIVNNLGDLMYINVEQAHTTLATQCPDNVSINNQPLPIRDNLLIFNKYYNTAHAIVGKNLIRYHVPENIISYNK